MFGICAASTRVETIRRALATAAAILLFTASSAAADTDKISFDFPLPTSLLGEGSSLINKHLREFQAALKSEAEMEIKFVTDADSWDKVIARLETEHTDVAWMPPYYYARARYFNPNSSIRPLAIYKTGSSIRSPSCIYVRKDAGHKNMQDIMAGRVHLPDESAWAVLNGIFADDPELSKYKIDPTVFFSGFKVLNRESSARALMFKTTDAIVLEPEYLKHIVYGHKPLADGIVPLVCAKPLPNVIIVYRKDMDERLVESLRLVLTNMHNYDSFKSLRHYFKISKGMWASVSHDDLKPWIDLHRAAVAGGWENTYKKYVLEK